MVFIIASNDGALDGSRTRIVGLTVRSSCLLNYQGIIVRFYSHR